jgi:hypothetical protein
MFMAGELKEVTFADFLKAVGKEGHRCAIRGAGDQVAMFIA